MADLVPELHEEVARNHGWPPSEQEQPDRWRPSGADCTVVFVDVVGFGAPIRNDEDRRIIRRTTYEILQRAFEEAQIPWEHCWLEDRGDGLLIIAPPWMTTARMLKSLPSRIASTLQRHNRRSNASTSIQLRMAVDVGPVTSDRIGVSGEAIIRAARLLDMPEFKDRLADSGACLGLVVSAYVHETIVGHDPSLRPDDYVRVRTRVKESRVVGWLLLHHEGRWPEEVDLGTGLGDDESASHTTTRFALPIYLILDTSSSMRTHEELLNAAITRILDTIFSNPLIAEFIRLSIVAFATRPQLILKMAELEGLSQIPRIATGGATNFEPLFDLIHTQIDADVHALRQESLAVLRPAVFLLTDGAPSDIPHGGWEEAHRRLTDPAWKPHPHIIAFGLGGAAESIIKRMATVKAFIADGSSTGADALAEVMSTMMDSMVASASARELRIPESVRGYRTVPDVNS